MSLKNIPIGKKAPEEFNVVVEIPQESQNKYEYDAEMDAIKLDRVLYSPFHYPVNYGFIPQTLSDDGDTLDAMVFSTIPFAIGTIVRARPIALFKMHDDKGRDYKILAVPMDDPRFDDINAMADLPKHTLKEIGHFFEVYKELEGKEVKVEGFEDGEAAKEEIRRAMKKQ